MIARLRRRHRLLVGVLSVVVVLAFIAALSARPAPVIAPSMREGAEPLPYDTSSWTAFGPGLRAIRERESGRERLLIERRPGLSSPDLLVYWAADAPAAGDLPTDAVLLGPLGDPGIHDFGLPAGEAAGTLILYSLGHGRMLAVEPLGSVRLGATR